MMKRENQDLILFAGVFALGIYLASRPASAAPSTPGGPPASQGPPAWYTTMLANFRASVDALTAAGRYEDAWREAARRDAWIASLGMLPTQWEAFV